MEQRRSVTWATASLIAVILLGTSYPDPTLGTTVDSQSTKPGSSSSSLMSQNSSQSCRDKYNQCAGNIDLEKPYVEVCNMSLQCVSDYFECEQKLGDNSIFHISEKTKSNVPAAPVPDTFTLTILKDLMRLISEDENNIDGDSNSEDSRLTENSFEGDSKLADSRL